MKNVFTYRDDVPDGELFAVKQVNETLAERKRAFEKKERYFTNPVNFIELFCLLSVATGCIPFLLLLGVEPNLKSTLGVVCLSLVGLGGLGIIMLFVLISIDKKRGEKSPQYVVFKSRYEMLLREVKETLSVPQNAIKCEALGEKFKAVGGKQKRVPLSKKRYLSFETEAWREDEAIYIFDGERIYRFPFENIAHVERVEGRVRFSRWHLKMGYHRFGKRNYEIRYKKTGNHTAKYDYRIRLYRDGEEYEILFPAYEKETLEKLTGKTLS